MRRVVLFVPEDAGLFSHIPEESVNTAAIPWNVAFGEAIEGLGNPSFWGVGNNTWGTLSCAVRADRSPSS